MTKLWRDSVDNWQKKADKKFDAIDKRFDVVDKRFDAVDKRFDAVDKRFEAIDKRFEAVDKRFETVDKRFDKLEGQLDTVTIIALNNREDIKWLKENMATKQDLSEMNDRMMGAFDKLLKTNNKTDQEQVFMGARVSRVESDVSKIKPLVGLN